jgi:hypothetical protein
VLRLLDDPTTPEGLKAFLKTSSTDLGDVESCRKFYVEGRVGATPKDLVGLSYWCVLPDLRALREPAWKVEPFDAPERELHYIDLELFNPAEDKRVYQHNLSGRPKLDAIPRDRSDPRYKEAGYLPFAIENASHKLIDSFRAGRLAGDIQRPMHEDHAMKWTGFLAHYVQDNTQPQHATQDYKSLAYFADKRPAPNVHSEVEWRMNDDDREAFPELRKAYFDTLIATLARAEDPIKTDDLWQATLEVADRSYSALPLIGLAAMTAAGQQGTPEAPTGPAGKFDTEKFYRFEGEVDGKKTTVLDMKARQQAWAVLRTARVIRAAWDAAHP